MILHKIILNNGSKASLDRVRSVLGEKSYAKLQDISLKRVNELARQGLDAYKSKVPIDTGALRNQNITLSEASRRRPEAIISVQGSHTGRRGHTTQSSILADYLNIGSSPSGRSLLRSRASDAISPYSPIAGRKPTAGWIQSARLAFAAARRKR